MTEQIELIPEAKQEALTPSGQIAKIIERAAFDPNFDPAKLAVLLEVKMKYEADESRKAFERAFEQFKERAPKILKTKHVSFPTSGGKNTEYDHAELHIITDIIGEALRSVGIVHQWKTSDSNGKTTVTCVLKGFGHTEEAATLSGPSDTSGGKNNIQAIGSTVTYLQRYTLLAATGLAAQGTDDDGKTEGMPEDAITDYVIQMQDCRNFEELKPVFAECYKKSKDAKDQDAQARFIKVYELKKKEFAEANRAR